jgi:hypothetical protein
MHRRRKRLSRYRSNPSIEMSDRYAIEGVKREYGHNWGMAWWREAIQNSVDAGATEIRLSLHANQDGTSTVKVLDNGTGMTQEILVNKFFGYGETGKIGAGTVAGTGGFGVAKGLLLFPWLSWKVYTQDLVAEGKIRQWDFVPGPHQFLRGTLLEVVMSADDVKSFSIANAVHVIQNSYIPNVAFWVADDKNATRQIKAELLGDLRPESIDGSVELRFGYDKSIRNSTIYIRHVNPVNGSRLLMFTKHVWNVEIPGYLTFDIMLPSLEVFAASRNKLENPTLEKLLDRISAEIIKSVTSFARKGRGQFIKKYFGNDLARFQSQARTESLRQKYGPQTRVDPKEWYKEIKEATEKEARLTKEEASQLPPSGQQAPVSAPAAATAASATSEAISKILGKLQKKGETGSSVISAATQQLLWKPDYVLINDEEGLEVPPDFWPQTMTKEIMRLLRIWAEFCKLGLSLMGTTKKFGVGFTFSSEAHAGFLPEDDTQGITGWILLNPVKSFKQAHYSKKIDIQGMRLWDPNETFDLDWLYAAAIHELTHMVDGISNHDDSFAYALTYNQGICNSGASAIYDIAKDIKLGDMPGLTRTQLAKTSIVMEDQPHAFRFKQGRRPADIESAPCSVCGALKKDHPEIQVGVIPKKHRRKKIVPGTGFYQVICTLDDTEQPPMDFATAEDAHQFMHSLKAENWRCTGKAYYLDEAGERHELDYLGGVNDYGLSYFKPSNWVTEAVSRWDDYYTETRSEWASKKGKGRTIFQRNPDDEIRSLERQARMGDAEAQAKLQQWQDRVSWSPKHQHYCDSCVFLGSRPHKHFTDEFATEENCSHNYLDFYYCGGSAASTSLGGTVLARFGCNDSQYSSMPVDVILTSEDLKKGTYGDIYRLAQGAGLIKPRPKRPGW